jgi:AraC-like DNA-binding protein
MSLSEFATVSALQIIPIVRALGALGLDGDGLLRSAGLPPLAQLDRYARVACDAELALWAHAVRESGDSTIGLRVSTLLEKGALGSFEYLLRNSETLEELLLRAGRYGRVLDDLARLEVQIEDTIAIIRIGRVGDYPMPAAGVECLFATVLSTVRSMWPGLNPLSVGFTHASAGDIATYERRFGCPVRFGAAANQLSCDAALLKQAARNADPELSRVLEDHTERLLAELPVHESLTEKARDTLRLLLDRRRAEPANLARALATSERTLRRRLQAEGTSYQALLDELRRSIALSQVKHRSDSLEQLAERLGFADTSAFYRAFKRWTGTTPAEYRKQ